MNTDKIGNWKQADGIQSKYADSGQAIGVYFYFTGTNKSGQTGTAANLGRILFSRNEQQKTNIDFDDLKKIVNERGGVALIDSTTAGAFEACIFLPFFAETFPSAIHILDDEEALFEWQPSDDGTVFANLTMEAYLRTADYPELGLLKINRMDETYTGQKSADVIRPKKNNIQALYIDDVDSVLTLVQVKNNGGTIQDSAPFGLLRGITMNENQIEDNTYELAKVVCNTPGNPDTMFNSGTEVTVSVSGAGDVGVITASWEET